MTTLWWADELPRIKCPTLLVMPGAETVGGTQNYEIMRAKIPDCELITYEGLPHNICDIVPDRCAADILAFLRRRFPGGHESSSDIAQVIRSKNAGPRRLTLDLMFATDADYQRVAQSPALGRERIGALYGRAGRRCDGDPVSGGTRDQDRAGAADHGGRSGRSRRLRRAAARTDAGGRDMSASGRVLDDVRRTRRPMRFLGASGQLGYGIPTPAFNAGLARKPDLIGCDMGSIDIGPTYLGKGEMATSPAATRRDLRKVLLGARSIDVPLVIGSAGSAGAAPHLEATLAIIRDIARAEGLHFRLGVLRADLSRDMLRASVRAGRVIGIDDMPALTEEEVTEAAHIVGQMGMGPFRRALAEDIDVLIAGRACDTAIFASLPTMLGFPTGLSVHMAKIIECASLCCLPGGRDSILATLDEDGFVLESMAEQRRATPVSVAAHSLYEQADPFTVYEPEGRLDLSGADYAAVDDRRCRVTGAAWHDIGPIRA